MRKFVLAICCIAAPALTLAAIYKHVDANGNISYSDQPAKGSTKVKLAPSTTFSQPTLATTPAQNKKAKSTAELYKSFAIANVPDQTTYQNQRFIPVAFSIDPALKEGDTVQLMVNSQLVGEPSTRLSMGLQNLERGTYEIQGVVLNKDKKVIQSTQPVTIYVKYASRLRR